MNRSCHARLHLSLLVSLALLPCSCAVPKAGRTLTTIAVRVHDLDAMMAFYTKAFGARFRPQQTGPILSQFAAIDGITLKFVPIRKSQDFVDFPSHQLGFRVHDVGAVIALAKASGGRQEGQLGTTDGKLHGAIRDPDGNTIELYQR